MNVRGIIMDRPAMREVTSLLLATLCMLGRVAGLPLMCGVDSRPHRDGICGEALIRARTNLCFLLANDFPDIFGRRSTMKRSVQELYAYPMEAFVRMDTLGNDDSFDITVQPVMPRPGGDSDSDLYLTSGSGGLHDAARRPAAGPATSADAVASQLASGSYPKRAAAALDAAPHVQKRGMVCDCCFNRCLPSTLARYC